MKTVTDFFKKSGKGLVRMGAAFNPIDLEMVARAWKEAQKFDKDKALKKAEQLYNAMKGLGTDDDTFWRITKIYSTDDEQRAMIRAAFESKYGKSLGTWIKGDIGCKFIIPPVIPGMQFLSMTQMKDCSELRRNALKAWGYKS